MNRRSISVIAVLILLPVIFSLIVIGKWRKNNTVVAKYGETVDIIEYKGSTLYAVPDPDSYMVQVGKYLGKVGDSLLGAPLYTVRDDSKGNMYVLVSEKGNVIFTKDGRLPAEAYEGTEITRAVFGNFSYECSGEDGLDIIKGITSLSSSAVYVPAEDEKISKFDLHVFFDSCPVCTCEAGTVLYFEGVGTWYFLSAAEAESAENAYKNGDTSQREYGIALITSGESIRYLKALLLPGSSAAGSESTSETTVGSSANDAEIPG